MQAEPAFVFVVVLAGRLFTTEPPRKAQACIRKGITWGKQLSAAEVDPAVDCLQPSSLQLGSKSLLEGNLIRRPLWLHNYVMTISSVQFSHSVLSDSLRPHEPQHARLPCPSPTPGSPPKPMSIESMMPSNHLILCRPLLLLPSIFPSIRVFSSESALHIRWPKDWSFSFNISPSNEHPGLISFKMDWLDLLAVQGTLKSLLQHHS